MYGGIWQQYAVFEIVHVVFIEIQQPPHTIATKGDAQAVSRNDDNDDVIKRTSIGILGKTS